MSHSHSNPATGLAPSHRLGPLLVLHWTVVDGRTNQPLNSLLPWEKNSPAVRRSISGFSFAQGPPWAPGPLSARRARPPAWNVISALPPSNHHLYGIQPKRLIGQTAPSNRFRPGGKTAKRCYSGCDLHSLRLLKHDNTPGESVSVYLKKEAEIDSAAICCCYSCVQNEQCTLHTHWHARWQCTGIPLPHTGPYWPIPSLSLSVTETIYGQTFCRHGFETIPGPGFGPGHDSLYFSSVSLKPSFCSLTLLYIRDITKNSFFFHEPGAFHSFLAFHSNSFPCLLGYTSMIPVS